MLPSLNRNNVVSTNYLETSIEEINKSKEKAEICKKCMELNLPQYNMGFNKGEWEKFANEKSILDKANVSTDVE